MLQVQPDWQWYITSQDDKPTLAISLGRRMSFTTPYTLNKILFDEAQDSAFSLTHMQNYLSVAELLEESGLTLTDAERTQIALNAAAAMCFHKPVAAKSWFFDVIDGHGDFHSLAELQNGSGGGKVLVLIKEGAFSTCLVISEHLHMHDSKQLKRFEIIKVMNDRLSPYIPAQLKLKTA